VTFAPEYLFVDDDAEAHEGAAVFAGIVFPDLDGAMIAGR
jgi:hypothetical protein